ncbi:hypothetical protein TEA_015556 [Camellia sinensis var. sinensis]|uniref:MBD domain-containing protein n=1 Tax=Camellia sinensis var. sinensis TaxID=542762 RepID=A0A4S4CXT4_CAMSN|nr:hypothetical protein TEA_015556 [Camellia sinensis var. sinensis]
MEIGRSDKEMEEIVSPTVMQACFISSPSQFSFLHTHFKVWLLVQQSFNSRLLGTGRQTFYSEQDLMRYINYAKRAKVSINAPRPNPPKVRKEAGKAAAVKQRSKGLMHASNQSDEESDNPEVVSLPSELPKKVRRDKAPNSASASDDEDAEFHLSNYYQ